MPLEKRDAPIMKWLKGEKSLKLEQVQRKLKGGDKKCKSEREACMNQ